MGGVPIYVYPFAIGPGYLILLDLSFSPWIFFLIWKLQAAIFSAMGWSTVLGLQAEQGAGAWLGIGHCPLDRSETRLANYQQCLCASLER